MRLAMKMPPKTVGAGVANDVDPREQEDHEVIDLASRNSYPLVARPGGKSGATGMVAGIAIVAALGAVTLWSMSSARLAEPEGIGNPEVAPPAQPVVAETVPMVPDQAMTQVDSAGMVQQADPAPSPVYSAPPQAAMAPVVNPYASPTVVFDSGAAPNLAGSPASAEGVAVAQPAGEGGSSANDFASRIGGVGGAPAQARAMTNPSTTVTQGTLIPAVLETAIDTNVPGYVRAVVSQDVRSFDGSKVLVPRSSRLIGQYQSGLQNGQKRAYVIWTRLIRPDGASVNLASPAIGFDGTTGLQGEVSGGGFFRRFGSAMLLSVVGGLGSLATGGASGVLIGGASQSAAQTAAQQDGQRGPTVRVRQGEPIRIFTARDLDFTQVS
ncbi:TrbI/VirB10 family protein [Qipengyuania spongiae]|uniref:Type VI secretion protein n=1 Tax=Qipengyuania spongiae TaxID=2909673 RepID=A0ABY5SXI2_9SPHN|nr:TrbI/VirB10 family protein [Qipengyuania spongiae]UVI39253.1 type VI secretion protein [Qipengyuania spongiae]